MNSLNILMTYDYVSELVTLTWKDLQFLIKYKYLLEESAVNHAISLLDENKLNNQEVMGLVCLNKDESIYPYIDILANEEKEQTEEMVQNKSMFIVLSWIYDNKDKFEDSLGAVEEVYSDFNYPEEISSFVRYMPMKEPDLGSVELNLQRLEQRWKAIMIRSTIMLEIMIKSAII